MLNPADLWMAGEVAEARRVELMRLASREVVKLDGLDGRGGIGRSLRRSIGLRMIRVGLAVAGSSQSVASAEPKPHRSLAA